MPLQPHRTFIDETTRLNAVYWTSKYAMRAVVALQKTNCPALPPPTVRERRNMGAGSPKPDRLLASLRVAAILHICSAFKHALASYFALCLLYRPKACAKTKRYRPVPDVLADRSAFTELRKQVTAHRRADEGGVHEAPGRVPCQVRSGLALAGWHAAQPNGTKTWGEELTRFQKIRHTIAHDQALDGADNPALSSTEIIGRATRLSEPDWQEMLGLFEKTIERLDEAVSASVAVDDGCALAVFSILERLPAATLPDIRKAILYEWRVPHPHAGKAYLRETLQKIGYDVAGDTLKPSVVERKRKHR